MSGLAIRPAVRIEIIGGSVAATVAFVVVAMVDWSPVGRQDPARAIGVGPAGIVLLGAEANRPSLTLLELVLFLAVGAAFILCSGLAKRNQSPGITSGLLYCTGIVWLIGGLRLSDLPWAFTLGLVLSLLYMPCLVHLGMIFPQGRLAGPGPRTFVTTTYLYFLIAPISSLLVFDPRLHVSSGTSVSENLLLISDDPSFFSQLTTMHGFGYLALSLIGLLVLFTRWQRGSPSYRRAFFPLWCAFLLLIAGKAMFTLASMRLPGTQNWFVYDSRYWAPALVPLAVVVGLSRYRTGRGRVSQLMVELGNGPPDTGRIQNLLRHTLQDPSAELWLSSASKGIYADARNRERHLSEVMKPNSHTLLRSDNAVLGVLVYDQSLVQQPELLEAVRASTSLLLDNLRLTESLRDQLEETRRSRERLVTASDSERRRLERDIHDGAQQQLIAAALTFRFASRAATHAQTKAILEEGNKQLEQAIGDLRELVRGVHPPVLRDFGLYPALITMAERASVPMDINTTFRERTAPALEACAYFTAAEAVTNTTRHALATHIEVVLHVMNGFLILKVIDDGQGGAWFRPDGGLAGLQDRAAALGGNLTIGPTSSGGTELILELPLPEEGGQM